MAMDTRKGGVEGDAAAFGAKRRVPNLILQRALRLRRRGSGPRERHRRPPRTSGVHGLRRRASRCGPSPVFLRAADQPEKK